MRLRHTPRFVAVGALFGAALSLGSAPVASAEPCPDVEIVFARGTGEPPGVGGTGQAFVDALRAQAGPQSVAVYSVNYPASSDFNNRIAFAGTVVDGVRDAGNRLQTMSANCPDTDMVLGGFSQGAVVAGYVTAADIPDGVPDEYLSHVPNPLPVEVADHVAAVVLLGNPSPEFLNQFGAPVGVIGPAYAGKTLELCAPGDTICDGTPGAMPSMAHAMYPFNGMVNEAASYAVGKLTPAPVAAG
ncbi:cutinase family protein [Mycobacterium sp. C31M]